MCLFSLILLMGLVAGSWWLMGWPAQRTFAESWLASSTNVNRAPMCSVLCAPRSALCEWLMLRPENSGRLMGIRAGPLAWARELARIAWTVCNAFSHTWKSVLSLELIALVFSMVQSVLIFGYTPRKPLSSVHFTTLKSLLTVLRRQGSSRSLYIDCCFANRMTERQTVL